MIPGITAGQASAYAPATLWTPANTTTALWLDADDASTFTLVAGGVSEWQDKSGNVRHASQSTSQNRPLWVDEQINGLAVVRFDGLEDYLSCVSTLAIFRNVSGAAIFVVAKWASDPAETNRLIVTGVTPSNAVRFALGGGRTGFSGKVDARCRRLDADTPVPVDSTTSPGTAAYLQCGIVDGTGGVEYLYVNGSQENSAALPSSGNFSDTDAGKLLHVGCNYDGLNLFPGDIGEVVVLQSAPTTDTRQRLEGYLAHKWGLAGSLPSDHPYKSSAPTV